MTRVSPQAPRPKQQHRLLPKCGVNLKNPVARQLEKERKETPSPARSRSPSKSHPIPTLKNAVLRAQIQIHSSTQTETFFSPSRLQPVLPPHPTFFKYTSLLRLGQHHFPPGQVINGMDTHKMRSALGGMCPRNPLSLSSDSSMIHRSIGAETAYRSPYP